MNAEMLRVVEEMEISSPGEQLRHAREASGMSVSDVASILKLSLRQVEALETDAYECLGATFAKGFLRNYARLLKLDSEQLLADVDRCGLLPKTELHPPQNEGVRMPSKTARPTRVWLILSGFSSLLLLAALALLYNVIDVGTLFGKSSQVTTVPQLTSVPPVQVVTSGDSSGNHDENINVPSSLSPSDPLVPPAREVESEVTSVLSEKVAVKRENSVPADWKQIDFFFDDEAWVEVTDSTGRTLLSQLNPKGSSQSVQGKPPISFVIGNAANVRVQYNNQWIDLKPHTRVEVARLTLE